MRRGRRVRPVKERLWARIDRRGPEECWLWRGPVNSSGYGYISVSGRVFGAHHVAWVLENGPVPRGLHVCHHCDTPRCCNSRHLFLATHAENIQDMFLKGRNGGPPPGKEREERSAIADLTPEQIQTIRHMLHAHDGSAVSIARRLHVSRAAVHEIWWTLQDEQEQMANV